MATPVDPYDRAAIEALASFGLWKQAGLLEALRLLEMLKRQQSPHTATELSHPTRQTTPPPGLSPDALELTKIERELIEDILMLFDDNGLSQEQTLSLKVLQKVLGSGFVLLTIWLAW